MSKRCQRQSKISASKVATAALYVQQVILLFLLHPHGIFIITNHQSSKNSISTIIVNGSDIETTTNIHSPAAAIKIQTTTHNAELSDSDSSQIKYLHSFPKVVTGIYICQFIHHGQRRQERFLCQLLLQRRPHSGHQISAPILPVKRRALLQRKKADKKTPDNDNDDSDFEDVGKEEKADGGLFNSSSND